jgi:hypothetical protein
LNTVALVGRGGVVGFAGVFDGVVFVGVVFVGVAFVA